LKNWTPAKCYILIVHQITSPRRIVSYAHQLKLLDWRLQPHCH